MRPSSDSPEDRRAAERFDALWNGAFADPLLQGVYPAAVAAEFAPLIARPAISRIIRQPVDFFGLTITRRITWRDAPTSLFGAWFGARCRA